MTIEHMSGTVGDVLSTVPPSAEVLVVIFKDRESGSLRIGWSKTDLASLCHMKEVFAHEIQQWISGSFRER